MADKWTTQSLVIDQAPGFLNDSELGVIDSNRFDRHIEEATLMVKHDLKSIFDLSLFPDPVYVSIMEIVAIRTAIIMLQKYQLGDQKQLDYLWAEYNRWLSLAAQGCLLDDLDNVIDVIGGVTNIKIKPGLPTPIEEVYGNGPRIGYTGIVTSTN